MKYWLRNVLVVSLALLYGCLISTYGSVSVQHVVEKQYASDACHYLSTQITDLYCHTGHPETLTNIVPAFPYPLKTSDSNPVCALRNASRLCSTTFSDYSFYADYLIRRLEKPDIVYPFHSFW